MSDSHSKDSTISGDNWSTLVLQTLSGGDTKNNVRGSEAGRLLSTIVPGRGPSSETPASSAQELATQSKENLGTPVMEGTPTSYYSLMKETVTSSTPSLLLQLSSDRSKNERLQRRQRRHLRQRQTRGASNKVCPGVTDSAHQVILTKETYSWILDIAPSNLNMNFQEVLVDLNTKNERGLYEARVKANVGGQPLTFYSLVGLENESFYRSMPRIIALALDALKT
ncbi:uncharacterized protein [Salminus brasiliensis]|uniref:uncharacterized protein n=1 Tax=Salminus brasiliensis TaxID=930266 RepID=UPI003B832882